MMKYLSITCLALVMFCNSNPTSKENDFIPTDHIIGTMHSEMRLVICIPHYGYYNLSSDSQKLGPQGQLYYDYLIPVNEMVVISQNLSDTSVFKWEDMTSVTPYPVNECYLLLYGNVSNNFMCSIGKGSFAGALLNKIIRPLSGDVKSSLGAVADSLLGK